MSSLEVDVDELDALGRRLRTLRNRFDTLGRDLGAYYEAVGSHRLNERLAEVSGNWAHHRQRIATEIEEVAGMVEVAAAHYRQTESDITSAARGQGI